MTIDEARPIFENWYISNRKVETDMHGNPPAGYIGNHSILTRNRQTCDGPGYLYMRPDRCWRAFSYRLQLPSVTNEREAFELWYREFQLNLNGEGYVLDNWSDMIAHNGIRYKSDIVQDCANAWCYCINLLGQGKYETN